MRLTRLPAALVCLLLLAGAASCATTIEGSGTLDPDVVTGGPAPGGSANPAAPAEPSGSDQPTSTPSPTVSAVQVRERALCVLERAAITGINTSFNKSKRRSEQIQILKQGATTIDGQLSRSGLPADDPILRAAKAVQAQLARLYAAASAGKSPSTKLYNDATGKFQQACNSIP
jgi:hypothetical protein